MRTNRKTLRKVRLELELLENRDAPSVTPWTTLSFDGSQAGSLPLNWSQWSSDGRTEFAVTTSPTPALSGKQSFSVASGAKGVSGDVSHAWLNETMPADVQVSAAVYVSSLIPAQVLARGSNLDAPNGANGPSFYAVELSSGSPGPKLALVKDVNGIETTLGTIHAPHWIYNAWLQETLDVEGSTVRAQLFDPKTGEYLNSAGQWQTTQAWALTVLDNSISGPGVVGLGRPSSYVGMIPFDDFSVLTPAAGMDAQDFDSSTASPSGWHQWSSDRKSNYFTVTAGPNSNFMSAGNVLQSMSVGRNITAQIWDGNESLTNAQVSTGMYLTTPMPAVQVIARGTGLGTLAPSYYGLSVTGSNTGPVVTLVRVNNGGSPQILAQLTPSPAEVVTSYISGKWIQVTLYVNGSSVRAQIYRADTGQYLNSEDLWQATPAYALNVTDTSAQALTGVGYGGLLRSNSSGTIYLDNFAIVPLSADSTPPAVTVSTPSGTLSGVVTVSAAATDSIDGVSNVEFYLDGKLRWVKTAAPYNWNFDTSFVSNGTHNLQVMAYDAEGNIGVASTTVITSNNTTITLPSFPRHQSSIGVVELAYKGRDIPPYDSTLLQNNVDAIVSDLSFLPDIQSVTPSTPQLIYTNVSNIYGSLLTSWLNYAEQNGIDPEEAFYHVSVATPFSYADGNQSVQPVNWFSAVYAYRNGSWYDYTRPANGVQSKTGVSFGSGISVAGDTINVGYTDKFRELDITLSQARKGGSYLLEYPTAVDSNGNPTTWSTLTTLSDTTNGLAKSGTITFDPPSNWTPAVVDGSANSSTRYYYVRFRTTTAFGTIPVASTILGANYTQAVDNGATTSGIIPAFDYAADTDHDGYLNAQEYANRAPGMNAYFAYQGRLFDYGQMRFFTNPSSPSFRDWALQYYPSYLNTQKYAAGYFVDNSEDNPPGEDSNFHLAAGIRNFNLVEPTAVYTQDYASLLNTIGRAIAPHWILVNAGGSQPVPGTNNGQTYADPVIQKVQAYYDEGALSAVSSTTNVFLNLYGRIYYRGTHDSPGYTVMDSRSTDGSETDGQTQLTTLAAYYLLAPTDPSQGALDFFGGEKPWTYWKAPNSNPPAFQHWSPAATFNIGTPASALPTTPDVFQTGREPDGSTYFVFDRKFSGQNNQPVLVLYKPISSSGSRGSSTSTTVALNGSYFVLQADGTLSSTAQTTISLENGEGAILVQAGTSTP